MNILNESVKKYLKELKLPEGTTMFITNLEKIIYDSNNLRTNLISKELLVHLLTNCNSKKALIVKDFITFENNFIESDKTQIILPLKNNMNNIQGCIIFVCDNKINNTYNSSLSIVKHNIEFFMDNATNKEYKNFQNNPIYNSKYITDVLEIIDQNIKKLFLDNNYQHIIELLELKIDTLKSNLEPHNLEMLISILNLLEEKEKYFGLYSFAIGTLTK